MKKIFVFSLIVLLSLCINVFGDEKVVSDEPEKESSVVSDLDPKKDESGVTVVEDGNIKVQNGDQKIPVTVVIPGN